MQLEVSKLVIFIEVNDEHPLNMLDILATCEVSKIDIFIEVKLEQPLNI